MLETLPLISTGLAVGFLVGLTGVEGGALMTLVLILGFSTSPVVAIATDLLFATITKLTTIPLHNRQDSIDWKSARMVWAGSIPGVVLGVVLVVFFLQGSLDALSLVLGFVLFLTGVSMLIPIDFNLSKKTVRPAALLGGSFIGLSVATTSVGAGALGMAIFRSLIGTRTSKTLVGTDIVHAIPVTLVAGAVYFSTGLVDIGLLMLLLLGSIPGALAGAKISNGIDTVLLRKILALVLLSAAVGLFLKTVNVFELVEVPG